MNAWCDQLGLSLVPASPYHDYDLIDDNGQHDIQRARLEVTVN